MSFIYSTRASHAEWLEELRYLPTNVFDLVQASDMHLSQAPGLGY